MKASTPFLLVLAGAAAAAGCNPPRSTLVPVDYRAIGLTFGGPASITDGTSTSYTATVSIERTGNPQRLLTQSLRVLVKNDPLPDEEIARVPIAWPPFDASPKTVSIPISCKKVGASYGVSGNYGSSEKGEPICAAGVGCAPNPAVTYALFDPIRSSSIAIACAPPSGGSPAGLCGACTGVGAGSCASSFVCHNGHCEEPCSPSKVIDSGCRCVDPPKIALCGTCSGLFQGNCQEGLVCHSGKCQEPCKPWQHVDGDCHCK
jgi:hypothetical protein